MLRLLRLVVWLYGNVMHKDEQNVVNKVLSMTVDRCQSRGRPKKIRMKCYAMVMNMAKKGV